MPLPSYSEGMVRRKLSAVIAFTTLVSIFNSVLISSAIAATTYSFSNAAATGRNGPTQAQVTTAYNNTSLAGSVTVNTQGIQEWVVPTSGKYQVITAGAAGGKGASGSTGAGKGVVQTVEVNLNSGDTLKIIVGQVGVVGLHVSGGGGGSFVFKNFDDASLITAAGGGGGGGYSGSTYPTGMDASTSQSGVNANSQTSGAGTSGGGGTAPTGFANYGGGGAGWNGSGNVPNGTSCGITPLAAASIKSGGLGGQTNGPNGGDGGFGGGGASAVMCGASGTGGGGGYSGGGAGSTNGTYGGGGGGGSYYISSATLISASATNTGNGYVTITSLGPSLTSFEPTTTITSSTTINYNITFSENVTGLAAGDFSKSGTGASTCTIGSPSGSNASYTIQLTGCSEGTVILTMAANAVSNATSQTAPSSGTSASTVTIDQTAPTISSVTAPANSIYKPSETPTFSVIFNESVTVTGSPRLTLTVGSQTRYANYVSMSDSKTALFRYTIGNVLNEFDTDGIAVTGFLDINLGTIRDLAANDLAIYTFSPPSTSSVLIAQRASAPTITSITPASGQLSINFTAGSSNGAQITNYKYSINGGAFTLFSPVDTVTPLVITGLTNGTAYAVRILGVNLVGDGDSSTAVTETPSAISVTGDSAITLSYGVSGSTGSYSASGGTNTFTWSLGTNILGVTISGSVVSISNSLAAGTYVQTVRATDGASAVGTIQLTIVINKASSTISMSLQGGGTSSPVGASPVLDIVTSIPGSVDFSSGGFGISACTAIAIASTSGTCTLPSPSSTGTVSLLAIFTPTSGNYETSTATFTLTIVDGVSTISISLAGGVTQAQKGKAIVITATINQAGKVTFMADGKRIPKCYNLSATVGNKTCSWTPSIQKQVNLTASLTPTNSVYRNSNSSLIVQVIRRTGTR
jgi:hypothetical protein